MSGFKVIDYIAKKKAGMSILCNTIAKEFKIEAKHNAKRIDKTSNAWKGASHPVKKVNHPGTKGFKTIESTLESNKAMVKSAIIKYWSDD